MEIHLVFSLYSSLPFFPSNLVLLPRALTAQTDRLTQTGVSFIRLFSFPPRLLLRIQLEMNFVSTCFVLFLFILVKSLSWFSASLLSCPSSSNKTTLRNPSEFPVQTNALVIETHEVLLAMDCQWRMSGEILWFTNKQDMENVMSTRNKKKWEFLSLSLLKGFSFFLFSYSAAAASTTVGQDSTTRQRIRGNELRKRKEDEEDGLREKKWEEKQKERLPLNPNDSLYSFLVFLITCLAYSCSYSSLVALDCLPSSSSSYSCHLRFFLIPRWILLLLSTWERTNLMLDFEDKFIEAF